MSKRAEEAAKEIYKDGIQLVGLRDRNNNIVIHPETMVGVLRNAAQRGYEQAEKDLALTPDDVWCIFNLVRDLQIKYSTTEGCLQEVVDIFNEQRKK